MPANLEVATGGIVPPALQGHTPDMVLPFDPERAREHLSHAAAPEEIRVVAQDVWKPLLDEITRSWREILGLEVLMDLGWIRTYGSSSRMTVQVSVMSEGGSGTPVPDMSIEVDNVEEALERVRKAGIAVEYGPATEPWGVRRFYVRDPFGKLINILQHE